MSAEKLSRQESMWIEAHRTHVLQRFACFGLPLKFFSLSVTFFFIWQALLQPVFRLKSYDLNSTFFSQKSAGFDRSFLIITGIKQKNLPLLEEFRKRCNLFLCADILVQNKIWNGSCTFRHTREGGYPLYGKNGFPLTTCGNDGHKNFRFILMVRNL